MDSASSSRIVLFPFMSKGHIISFLHLSRLLLHRGIAVTIFTTPANSPFIRHSLADTDASVVDLPFPQNVPGIPAGVESTDRLPSMSLFLPLANATKLMQPDFEHALQSLPSVSCIVSDGFLGWTLKSAEKLGIPRFVLFGMSNYAATLTRVVVRDRPHAGLDSDDEPFNVPSFEWIKLTRNDFESPLKDPETEGPCFEFAMEQIIATSKSQGLVVNSFYELEPLFLEYWNRELDPKAWCVGPLCMAEPPRVEPLMKSIWVQWLDTMLVEGGTVIYVAFGTQAEISSEQLQEIAIGLEKSEVNFLWVVRSKGLEALEGFEERVKGRGVVVQEWVEQREILHHESVIGFMSHCGWNSVMESICACVPILAWPMMAEQHLNARMVAEELGVGLKIMADSGSVRGFVKSGSIEKMVRELMEGGKGKEVRKKVKEVGEAARRAMAEGGSSRCTLDQLIVETCKK
ncbi:hypothetical protein HHK36_015137 [Tetracentron sinense]|uniref:Glycosyltransferase n=1 Tax=Tetracentron sinense TaxID=13715 RepID=A0A835DFW5_TETSI|nr:hypothetical protein HHK36_015137 [Tetracentron sinense]